MSEAYIGEIRIFAGNFAPRSWAFCNGQLLPIAQNTALFSLIGTTYGGDGRTTTALPNLQGRAPMHPGRGPGLTVRKLGEKAGVTTVTLTEAQMPAHTHTFACTGENASQRTLDNNVSLGRTRNETLYQSNTSANLVPMNANSLPNAGGGGAHNNLQPYLTMNFIIALQGTYPSRS